MNVLLHRILACVAGIALLTGCAAACLFPSRPGPSLASADAPSPATHRCCVAHANKTHAPAKRHAPGDHCPLCRTCPLAGTLPLSQPDHRSALPSMLLLAVLPAPASLQPFSNPLAAASRQSHAPLLIPPSTLLDLSCALNT